MKLLKKNLEIIRDKFLANDWDWFHGIVGYERSGKSTLGLQICRIIDPEFSVKNVVFTADQFFEVILKAKPMSAILIDEGIEFLYSRDAMKRETKRVNKILAQIGKKNLFICLCIPDLWSLDLRIRSHRMRTLCRIEKRGWFYFYSPKRFKEIRFEKFSKKIIWPKANFIDNFKPFPEKDKRWMEYIKEKNKYLQLKSELRIIKMDVKYKKRRENSIRFKDFAIMHGISYKTAWVWLQSGIIKKSEFWRDLGGRLWIYKNKIKTIVKRVERLRKKKLLYKKYKRQTKKVI